MARKAGIEGVEQVIIDLEKVPELAEEFAKQAVDIIPDVIRQAKEGNGPGNRKFKPYTKEYQKIKDAASGEGKRFMYGPQKGGQHMLDRKNFMWEVLSKTSVQLVWTASGKQGDYARAHNEGLGKMPKREWMHLKSLTVDRKINILIRNIVRDRIDIFNDKYRK